ncbi:MAG: tetratricopeptide repeat protein [Planctomycetia bacterium]|nr:tetratricopeptide repeat protein [Planctomycetia bacterium]
MNVRGSLGRRSGWTTLSSAVICLLVGFASGCDQPSSQGTQKRGPASQTNVQGGLFDSVVENLDRLEQFDPNQMLPQICDRLNQWYVQDKPKVDWQPDPLLAGLPNELRNLAAVKTLDVMKYRLPDAWYLQESVWLRDISKVARRDQFEDLAVAQRLFDWTVRNIQLEPDATIEYTQQNHHRPYETLLLGRGQAVDRAWIFMLLARQQGLDVVLLGVADESGKTARPWLPALLIGGELHLFDCRLGLPIPGPEGRGVATLAQAVADPRMLRRLDLDNQHSYPLEPEDLKHVVAYIEGSPSNLSRRMALVESRLAGKRRIALTSPGSALVDRLKNVPHLAEVKLWPLPFEIWLWQSKLGEAGMKAAAREMVLFQAIPTLMLGRALYFKGVYDGEKGANKCFLNARPPNRLIADWKLPPEAAKQVKREDISKVEAAQVLLLQQGKQSASFWLGLVAFEQQDFPSAIDWFGKRTLEAAPNGPWSPAARYNLARAYEAVGELDRAIALYESDNSLQSHGNKLRARWLKEARAGTGPAENPAAK